MPKEIKIVPKLKIEPEGGFRIKVKSGESIQFVTEEHGGKITFPGESPFDKKELHYKDGPVLVTKAHVPGDPAKNVYPFICEIEIPLAGQVLRVAGVASGGELEIDPGP